MVEFNIKAFEKWTVISFNSDETLQPEDLKNLHPPDPVMQNFANKGIILSGRGPVWLYGFLIHFYHPTKFVATYDPRLAGAVVVESPGIDYKVGDVIPIDISIL